MSRLELWYEQRDSSKLKGRLRYSRSRLGLPPGWIDGDFECLHCGQRVSFDPLRSGVNNRNHCPYCLWSRHLDLHAAGDRLSACKARMKPVGLALKRTRKKYGLEGQGELMLVHHCLECGKVSLNRIAADDFTAALWEVFEGSQGLDSSLRARLKDEGISILDAGDAHLLHRQLSGQAAVFDLS